MRGDRPPRLRLFDMLDAIGQIEAAVSGLTPETLAADAMRYRAIERWLEIISEASRHIGDDLRAKEPGIEWRQIASIGNVLRHGYQSIDHRVLWNIVQGDLPTLNAAVERLYAGAKLPADPWPDPGTK